MEPATKIPPHHQGFLHLNQTHPPTINHRKRQPHTSKNHSHLHKRPRIPTTALDARAPTHTVLTNCVSTSESSVRIINSEHQLHSSTQQPFHYSNNLQLMLLQPTRECDRPPQFSIRDYVFSARNNDISKNWPFSQKNLQLCLKHGVKNVLPPFEPVDSLRDNSVKRFLVETSVSSKESNLNERQLVMKNHSVPSTAINHCWNQGFAEGFRDLGSFPLVGEKDLAFQTTDVICQSEVGSVSTSNLPLSEVVSDEHEAAASAANKTKSPVSQIFDKKCRSVLKFSVNNKRATPEDITSACTVPSEATASKICPVCENFSSSSNTTLNAHIDQCLSSQSSPNWMKDAKLINPRVKPRKMRSMVDICATAPRCTLEDLDRRNGSNWATNLDTPEDTGLRTEGSNHRVSSRYTVNNRDDDSVYIDPSGTKIRIISKFNETVSSSIPKTRDNQKGRKQSKKGKRSILFSASRKRRIVKHLKYLRVTRQKKHLLSLKVKERSAKAFAAEKATCAGHESHMKHQPPGLFGEVLGVLEKKRGIVSETSGRCSSSKIINLAKKNDPEMTTKVGRYDLRVRSNHTVAGRKPVKKLSHFPKKPLLSIQPSMREEHRSSGPCGKTGHSTPKSKFQVNKETFLVPSKLGASGFNRENTKDCVWKSLDSDSSPVPSLEIEIEVQPDTVPSTGRCTVLHSFHTNSFEGMRSSNSKAKEWSTDTGEQFDAKHDCDQGGLGETNSFSERYGGDQCNYGFARSADNDDENDDPVSSSSLAIGETDFRSDPSSDPELQEVADVSPLLSNTMQCTEKFQSSLPSVESKGHLPQHNRRVEQMLYRDVSATEGPDLKMGNSSLGLMAIDPILIPGPPGCDLPSFSDMGSGDFLTSSSPLEQLFEDEDNVVNRDSSDSLFSAASSIFNLGVPYDHVYQRWIGASPPMNTLTVLPQSTVAETERVASTVNDLNEGQEKRQPCSCSRKEGIPWSAAMNIQESQLQGRRMSSLVAFPGEKFTYSSLTKWPYGEDDTVSLSTCRHIELNNSCQTLHQTITPVRSHRTGDCDLATPAPILRLMGKNLMVVNNEEDDPSLASAAAQNVYPISETSSKHHIIWDNDSSQSAALIAPLPYVKDSRTFSVKCFDSEPSNIMNSFQNPNKTPGDPYVNRNLHPNLGILGAAPLER